ncbi:MAG: alpha/beta hydrolase [Thiogranum sp.]
MGERHRPAARAGEDCDRADSIEAYLDACRKRVEAARCGMDDRERAWVVEGNSPFMLRPEPDGDGRTRRGILMVHGLTDAPFMMRDIAGFFQQQGFLVLAMQLPGHGTRPGDLLDIRWQDWVEAHQHLLDLLGAEVDDLYLLGFSIGATLNLYQSVRNSHIKGLFLFAPAVRVIAAAQLTCPLAWLGKWWWRMNWFNVQPDSDAFKYESLSNRAICEAHRLIRALHRVSTLVQREIPLFVVASEKDATVDSGAILKWFARQTGAPRRMLYYSTGHPAVPAGVRVVPASFPQRNIRSYAHTALLQAPDNPHYGAAGSYRFCTHYYQLDPHKYELCKRGEESCLGEMFDESGDCPVIRRLTYNPSFDEMLAEIREFLLELEPKESG